MGRRAFRAKDHIGEGHWSYKESETSCFSTMGVDDEWRDPNATVEQLLNVLAPLSERNAESYFFWEEWQKVGRSVQMVEVKEKRQYLGEKVAS
jgi:hypothetical protein